MRALPAKDDRYTTHTEVLHMLARPFMLLSLSAGAVALAMPAALVAQETPAPQVANSPYQFAGEITADNVYVRSGPREGDYATMKLDRGAPVTVVGIKFDWLKILPPEGSFSYVSKAFVQQYGDGTRGRVTKNELSVRAGSSLNALKNQVQTKLMEGDEVEIIGEKDEYFKIKPPPGAYLYVRKDFVRPVRALSTAVPEQATPTPTVSDPVATDVPAADAAVAADIAPADTPADVPAAAEQPAATADAGQKFNQLEEQYRQISTQPLEDQPIQQLLTEYEAIVAAKSLPDSILRIAESRANALKVRLQAQQELAAIRREHAEMAARQQALAAEQAELEQRLRDSSVAVYTAVGVLRPSSLQRGDERLYRLTDPASGRTLIYIRSNDNSIVGHIGQFVGVRGQTASDPLINADVLRPTTIEVVDMNRIGRGVAAQILPPSLFHTAASASTGSE